MCMWSYYERSSHAHTHTRVIIPVAALRTAGSSGRPSSPRPAVPCRYLLLPAVAVRISLRTRGVVPSRGRSRRFPCAVFFFFIYWDSRVVVSLASSVPYSSALVYNRIFRKGTVPRPLVINPVPGTGSRWGPAESFCWPLSASLRPPSGVSFPFWR